MRGHVEVYKEIGTGQQLVESGNNLLLDGFSEQLVNILTVNSVLSTLPSTSAILDVSNFTVQAISYGKAASGYLYNCHGSDPITLSGLSQSSPELYLVNQSDVSSYRFVEGLPKYPDPRDKILEYLPSSVAELIREHGQNLNALHYATACSSLSALDLSSVYQLGCYAVCATGTARTLGALFTTGSSLITSGRFGNYTVGTGFNGTFSSMDWRGFQGLEAAATSLRGLLTSALTGDLSSTGKIAYEFKIVTHDLQAAALFGGIQTIGLWVVDLEKTLPKLQPPFAWNPANNQIEYKLVAKKVLANNLCYIEDSGSTPGFGNFSTVTGTWYIYFV